MRGEVVGVDAIEIVPKTDEMWADNVCYSIPRPSFHATIKMWNDKRRMRHAMKMVKRLFKGNVPHIENAHTLELIEGRDGCCYLRIRMADNG